MYANHYPVHVSFPRLFRRGAHWTAAILAALWIIYVVVEAFNPDFHWAPMLWVQGAALAVVFAGYVIAFRNERAGGVTILIGTLTFFLGIYAIDHMPPQPATLCFALPGVLYLAAREGERRLLQVRNSYCRTSPAGFAPRRLPAGAAEEPRR